MIDVVANFFHVLSVLVWIGGMFYTLFVLKPSLGVVEEKKILFMETIMGRFFTYVWIAILILAVSGGYRAHLHVKSLVFDIKLFVYTVMVLVFSYIYFGLYRKLKTSDMETKPKILKRISFLIKLNFGLGLLIIFLIEFYKKGV